MEKAKELAVFNQRNEVSYAGFLSVEGCIVKYIAEEPIKNIDITQMLSKKKRLTVFL